MRRSFLRVQGIGPNEYRARFNNAEKERTEVLQKSFLNDRSSHSGMSGIRAFSSEVDVVKTRQNKDLALNVSAGTVRFRQPS